MMLNNILIQKIQIKQEKLEKVITFLLTLATFLLVLKFYYFFIFLKSCFFLGHKPIHRLVSWLRFLSKLVECVVAAQIRSHIEIILDTQSSQSTKLDTQQKLSCCAFRVRYTFCCPRACP